jgi:C_GCAxxG_C_C family probable redox protein
MPRGRRKEQSAIVCVALASIGFSAADSCHCAGECPRSDAPATRCAQLGALLFLSARSTLNEGQGRNRPMSERVSEALERFTRCNCSQAVLAAYGPKLGLSETDCLRVAACFGAGMGRLGKTCGALTGGLMVVGLRHGQEMIDDPQRGRDALYAKVQALTERFEAAHGSSECRALTGCDLTAVEGRTAFAERGLHHSLCDQLVAFMVEELG